MHPSPVFINVSREDLLFSKEMTAGGGSLVRTPSAETKRRFEMKKAAWATLFLLPMLILLGTTGATAQTPWIEGTWEIAWENRLGEVHEFTVTLEEQEGGPTLEGTAEIPRAFFSEANQTGTKEVPITDGDTSGRLLTFKIQQRHSHHEIMHKATMADDHQMNPHVIALYGVVDDAEMEGYLTGVMGNPATAVPFEATKLY